MFILLQTRIRIEAGRMTNKEMRVLEDSAEPVLTSNIVFDVYLVMYCLTSFIIHDFFHRLLYRLLWSNSFFDGICSAFSMR